MNSSVVTVLTGEAEDQVILSYVIGHNEEKRAVPDHIRLQNFLILLPTNLQVKHQVFK